MAGAGLICVCGLLTFPRLASAQTCEGFADFAGRPWQVGGSVTAGNGTPTGALNVAVGGHALFGGAEFDWIHFQDIDTSAPAVGGEFGVELPAASGRVFVCPIVSVFRTFGPTFDGVTFRDLQTALSGNVGVVMIKNATVAVIPTASLAAVLDHASATAGSESESDTSGFGVLALGVGLVFAHGVALVPSVQFPIHLDGAHPQGSVAFRVNF